MYASFTRGSESSLKHESKLVTNETAPLGTESHSMDFVYTKNMAKNKLCSDGWIVNKAE